MCEVLDRVGKRGIELGIEALVLDNIENGFDKTKILPKVVKYFGVSGAQAEEYFERFAS